MSLVLLREWSKRHRIHYKEALKFFERYHPDKLQSFSGYFFVHDSLSPQEIGLRREKMLPPEKVARSLGISTVALLRYALAGYVPPYRYVISEKKGRVFIRFPNQSVETMLPELVSHLKEHTNHKRRSDADDAYDMTNNK